MEDQLAVIFIIIIFNINGTLKNSNQSSTTTANKLGYTYILRCSAMSWLLLSISSIISAKV